MSHRVPGGFRIERRQDGEGNNFVRRHQTLRITPAQAAGLTTTWYDYDWLEAMIADRTPNPQKPGPKVETKYRPRKPKGSVLPPS